MSRTPTIHPNLTLTKTPRQIFPYHDIAPVDLRLSLRLSCQAGLSRALNPIPARTEDMSFFLL